MKKIQYLDKIIDEKRNEISSIKEIIVKEELNQSYLNNDMIKSKKSLVEADKQIKILSEREKRYIEESEKLEAQPKQVNLKIENFLGIYNNFKNDYEQN